MMRMAYTYFLNAPIVVIYGVCSGSLAVVHASAPSIFLSLYNILHHRSLARAHVHTYTYKYDDRESYYK